MKKEGGYVIVEAVFVMVIAVFLMSVLMGLGFVLYQQTNLTVAANDAASKAASVYSQQAAEPFTGYVHYNEFSKPKLYQYWFEKGGFFFLLASPREENRAKAQWVAEAQLDNARIIEPEERLVEVSVDKHDSFGSGAYLITVNLQETYKIPGAAAFQYFGVSDEITFYAVGTAVSKDMRHIINSLNFQEDLTYHIENNVLGAKTASKLLDAVRAVAEFINSLF